MADRDPTTVKPLGYDALIELSSRLLDHANDCMGRRDVAADMRAASRALGRYAVFKSHVREIAHAWTPAAACDLRAAIAAAEREEG